MCHVWHLSFQRLADLADTNPEAHGLYAIVNNIPTAYHLAFWGSEAKTRQSALFRTAGLLTGQDSVTLKNVYACLGEWFPEEFGPEEMPCAQTE